jgi:hypothetical protein
MKFRQSNQVKMGKILLLQMKRKKLHQLILRRFFFPIPLKNYIQINNHITKFQSTKPADTQQQAKPDPRTSPANDAETTKMAELVENNTQQVVQSPAVNGAEIPTVTELTENQGHAFAENPHDEEVDSHAKSPSIPPEDQCGISHDSIASSDRKANESSDNSQYFISPKTNGSESNSNEPRRRSTRDIKRPKFDDELVESIHIAPPKVAQRRRQSSEKLTSNPPLEVKGNNFITTLFKNKYS